MSSSDWPFSRRAWKARNWSSGCSGARWTFSANESSSAEMSTLGSRTTQGTGAVLARRFCLTRSCERPVAPPAGRDLEHAGLHAVGVENRPDVEALQERAPGDVLGQLLDRDAGLHAADVRLGQDKLVEGYVARRRQDDLLNGRWSSGMVSMTGAERLSLGFQPVTQKTGAALSLSSRPETRGPRHITTRDPGRSTRRGKERLHIAMRSICQSKSKRWEIPGQPDDNQWNSSAIASSSFDGAP